jgi:DNA invertase Pin-like site-specific DNA recombinase
VTHLVGYTREFFTDAGVSADAAALKEAGAELVFSDVAADVRARPELKRCLRSLEPGEVLVVTSAARLSHGVGHFVATTTDLAARGVSVRSLAEPALSTLRQPVPAEEVLAALEGLRRRLVSLSTREGMDAAAAEGRHAGRPSVMTEERVALAEELRRHDRSFAHIARVLGVSASAVQRALSLRSDGSDVSPR